MKLAVVLMLTALPLYCYGEQRTPTIGQKLDEFMSLLGGSGCADLEYLIDNTIDPAVTEDKYINDLEEFQPDEATEEALRMFKQCFLHQSNRTLSRFSEAMDAIYNSEQCASY